MTLKLYFLTKVYLLFILFSLTGNICIQAETSHSMESGSDSTLIAYLNENGIQLSSHNQLKLLKSGHEKFIDLFQEIEKAKHHIHLEYFNFRNDSIANALFEVLERKAKEGVEIRAMYDAFGNSSNNQPLNKNHIQSIRERGI